MNVQLVNAKLTGKESYLLPIAPPIPVEVLFIK